MSDSLLPPIEEVPAAHLIGRDLDRGWRVQERVAKDAGATGGCFSVSYLVSDETGSTAFMKALNFHAALDGDGDIVDQLHAFTEVFKFERDLLCDCRDKRMSRVITLIDSGTVEVPEAGPFLSQVPYLIFEKADGDIRGFQAQAGSFDCAWGFRVMKHAIQGIGQLHSARAAHQDLKPSNVLTLDGGREMKLGDLGRAERREVEGPWSEHRIPGAVAYAPPEQQYGAFGRTWEERRAADLYLAGSLGVQLFLGHCLSVLLQQGMPREARFSHWQGTFEDVLPHLYHAHSGVMTELHDEVLRKTADPDSTERFVAAVMQMTDPDPLRRGHPKDRAAQTSSYSVQRFTSQMELLAKRAEMRLIGKSLDGPAC
jgi:serine/threonine protein kinase